MYTTIIHPIRKALCLSIEEYVVLDSVYHLSHNDKYGHWCVMSKDRLAKSLDLSRATIFRILDTLETKGLIIRDQQTGYTKTTDSYNEMIANKEDWLIGFEGKETALISGKFNVQSQNDTTSLKLTQPQSQNETIDSLKLRPYIYNNNNNKYKNTRVGDFDTFWTNYPKKRNKGLAERSFKKIHTPINVLLVAIEKQKKSDEWKKEGGRFIPHPSSWLNAKGWENETDTEVEKGNDYYIEEMKLIGVIKFSEKHGKELAMKYSQHSNL